MKARTVALLCPVLLVVGCNGQADDAMVKAVMRENAMYPAGRFISAGKREYPNGTEIYVLDTATGQLCYSLITNDGQPDSRFCGETIFSPGL